MFVRYGKKNGWQGAVETTVLLSQIHLIGSDEILTDHLWFNQTKGFKRLGRLREGDIIEFDARVAEYEKGYHGWREDVERWSDWDFKLERPTKLMLIRYSKPQTTTK